MILIDVYFRRLKINHDCHEFILESGTVANITHIYCGRGQRGSTHSLEICPTFEQLFYDNFKKHWLQTLYSRFTHWQICDK
jgi:hypothetical protein